MDIKKFLPLPDILKCKKILCIEPHPDDNEVGAGGTIAKLAKQGCSVTCLVVTDGSMGTKDPCEEPGKVAEKRWTETINAAKILGISSIERFDYKDGTYPDEKELAQKIAGVIRKVEPEIVMTVDPFLPYESHPDHRRVGMASAEACLFSEFPHFHSYGEENPGKMWEVKGVAFYNTAYPNTFINVDDTWDVKFRAIAAHESQFSGEALKLYSMYFDLKSRQLSEGRGYQHAEAFKVLTPLLMHANVDAVTW